MEVSMSLNALVRLPLSTSPPHSDDRLLIRHSLVTTRTHQNQAGHRPGRRNLLLVQAKGKRGMMDRSKRPPQFSLPKLEDDGNPKFVIFIRMENVYLWYPLSVITGGTTAKIMVAAKDNVLGKYIYKGAIDRNLAAVIYKDEKEIQKTAFKQYRVLRSAKEFRYGYKLVENNNVRSALSPNDVIELPTPDKLKTVVDKVKDFFGDAKESFGKLTSLDLGAEEPEKSPEEKSGVKN
uniref:Protein HHL1, chloroplastic n=1 Tax=Kalanchoe fedtschenkoi TaxID=63787 RepID=A0A7N1A386_KALFE